MYICGLFSGVIDISDPMESKDGIILIGNDVKGNGPRIITGIVPNLPGETEEN